MFGVLATLFRATGETSAPRKSALKWHNPAMMLACLKNVRSPLAIFLARDWEFARERDLLKPYMDDLSGLSSAFEKGHPDLDPDGFVRADAFLGRLRTRVGSLLRC
jgi:hypothetical protein